MGEHKRDEVRHAIATIRDANVSMPVAGRCIYCDRAGPFSLEHVIPTGLCGNLLLPEASCRSCAKITSAVERDVMRGPMRDARAAMGLRSKHKHPDQRRHVQIRVPHGGRWKGDRAPEEIDPADVETLELGQEQAPPWGMASYFGMPPGILEGRPPGFQNTNYFHPVMPPDLEVRGDSIGPDFAFEKMRMRISDIQRMVAKIAHSFAVGCLGYGAVDWFLQDFIRSDKGDGNYWISSENTGQASSNLHEIILELITVARHGELGWNRYWVVTLFLFSNIPSAPRYTVVVGSPK